jgi:EAL domain-containing protein (putative c-di-GMP-specific phosphodiesterase class I)/AmiR/NasT family two-component response regulator
VRISVLIADDEQTVRDTVAAVVKTDPDLEIVGEASDAQSAIDLASEHRPDVAILDVRMPGGGGVTAAREIIRRSPPTRVLALSAHQDTSTVLSMLRAGAIGYILKGDSTEAIVAAVHRCVEMEATISDAVASDVAIALAHELHKVLHDDPERELRRDRVRRVLNQARVRVVFQPVFDVATGEAVGAQALARFDAEPHRSTDQWFAEAAAVGLHQQLELAATASALADFDRLPRSAFLSVNVSPDVAVTPEFEELLRTGRLDRLVIELSEHAPVGDYGELTEALASLRADGLRIAIGDAGAAFSSMRHIVQLVPDLVKVDAMLVHGLDRDEARRAVVRAIASFASLIDAVVVAQGVETAGELDALGPLGITLAQGIHLGRPGPLPLSGGGFGRRSERRPSIEGGQA